MDWEKLVHFCLFRLASKISSFSKPFLAFPSALMPGVIPTQKMKRIIKYFVFGLGAAIIFCLIFIFCLGYFLGTHTKYCPLGHKISDTSACVVLDRDGDRILIQHADLDINVYSLEIIDGNKSSSFKFPSFIHQLAPKGYTAGLIKNENDTISINGSRYSLEPN